MRRREPTPKVPPLASAGVGGVKTKMLRVGVRQNDMDSYQHEMGRPPLSPKHTKIQTPHKTSKQQNDPKKLICMTTPNQNFNRNKEREKKNYNSKSSAFTKSNALTCSTCPQKKIRCNQYLFPKHNIAPTIKISSQPEQQINKKKIDKP
ncbi:hypothetical protein TNCV_4908021 [Trichonephila clavipes]|uniref:Uncharacterized protein n=1 Tax=Trichonephila clavipes TaxID=2585209 RepID=A0A8X6V3R1_TRICX|nr:hypothetical protein TNCV_4908021 [Trichonephila clavipes]